MSTEIRSYPRRVKTDAGEIEFRHMTAADEAAVLAFAQKLPVHDLLFIPRNISEPKVLSAWIKEIDRGGLVSLLAIKDGAVVGCGTIVRDLLSWSPHVGEIRMVVSKDVRGLGVGRALSQETFALALGSGLEKIVAQMTVDQTGAIALFESLGYLRWGTHPFYARVRGQTVAGHYYMKTLEPGRGRSTGALIDGAI